METINTKSLERKTKAELIDIILRKDAVERNIRADIKGTEKAFEKAKAQLELANEKICKARQEAELEKSNFEYVADELATAYQKHENLVLKNRIFYPILILGLILAIIF